MQTQRSAVDWTRGQIRVRYVKGQARSERIYPVVCPTCGRERWLKRCDALKTEQMGYSCYHCAQSIKGRKGWRVTCSRWGVKVAVKHQQAYRLAHPSNLEQACMTLLDSFGVEYEREVWMEQGSKVYLIDFVVEGRLAIEVNGAYAHRFRAESDALKQAEISSLCPLLVLLEDDFTTDVAQQLLRLFLHQHL